MDDSALDRLFSGDLDKLIPLPKRVVRLFISSTFTDMTLERNSLMERVYPRLKKYCRERFGLDFQVVDMRWGVRDEATDDHQTVNLCSREIDNCQRMSLGPNFVALLGDKYGFRPLCNRIKSSEYRALRRCLIELDINTDFLDAWYKEDLNAVPPEYLLQPISSILKNFTNKKEPELQSVDQRIWHAIQERLHELLMIGSGRLVKQGRMSEKEQLMKYSISVTEREVIEGCLDVNDAKSHCLVYVRSILDLRQHLDECLANLSRQSALSTSSQAHSQGSESSERRDSAARKASLKIGDDAISLTTVGALNPAERRIERARKLIGRYIDLNSKDNTWRLDEEAQKALAHLKEIKLSTKLKPNGRNLKQYKVLWNEQEGVGLKSDEHKHYLNELVDHFYTNVARMIRKASTNEQEFKSGLIGEVLQHSHYAKHVSKTFHGRSGELEKVRSYILSEPETPSDGILPMFIYGVGGSGKTSILARAATLAKDWILSAKGKRNAGHTEEERWDQKPCIIMRFCCTTPSSSSMVGVLTSVCRQLQFNFYQFGPLNGVVSSQMGGNAMLNPKGNATSPSSAFSSSISSSSSPSNNVATAANTTSANTRDLEQLKYQPIPEDFVRLVFTFRQLLENCHHHYHRERLFLIVLDSVEHLTSPAESSVVVKYSWLTSIAKLPPNVRLIVSCSSEQSLEPWSEDYLHLKRHFLLSYYASLRQSEAYGGGATTMDFVAANSGAAAIGNENNNNDDGDFYAGLASGEFPLGDKSAATHHQHQSSKLNKAAEFEAANDGKRYHLLKRVILPAMRFIRLTDKTRCDAVTVGAESRLPREFYAGDLNLSPSSNCSLITTGRRRKMKMAPPVSPVVSHLTTGRRASKLEDHASRHKFDLTTDTTTGDTDASVGGEYASDGSQRQQMASYKDKQQAHVWILHVRPMGIELGLRVIQRWLGECGRTLTQQQWSLVEKSFAHCSRPIFVKLAFGEIVNWKSYSVQSDTKGLRFGSSLLDNDENDDDEAAANRKLEESLDPALAILASDCETPTAPDFKWQILSMEQQWLNYLDYKQRKEQSKATSTTIVEQQTAEQRADTMKKTKKSTIGGSQKDETTEEGTVVIRVGALSSARVRGSACASSLPTSTCRLSNTIDDAICQLFARIELQHGYVLTKHSLSYITAARNGICENELEDILSLDDVVLDDVFQYHLPPVRRIPPLLWTRIRNDLPDYLSERDADGIVINWHHSQFELVARKRYLSDPQQVHYIHSNIADYFLGKWADKAKPFRCTKQQVQMAAEQLESAAQQTIRDSQQFWQPSQQPGEQQQQQQQQGEQQQQQQQRTINRTSIPGSRFGCSSTNARTGASFSVRSRLRSSDQHDQRLQWMQAKADRCLPHQPLYYSNTHVANEMAAGQTGNGNASATTSCDGSSVGRGKWQKRRYNLRKLTELPYHLMKSGRFLDLANEVLFNYKWLFAALDALGLQCLLSDFSEASRALERAIHNLECNKSPDGGSPNEITPDASANLQLDLTKGATVCSTEYNLLAGLTSQQSQVGELDADVLRSMLKQVNVLNNTIRLSCSALHSDTQMLAPQLIGRLLPLVRSVKSASDTKFADLKQSRQQSDSDIKHLAQLLDQCDKDGCSDCSLLPTDHCLQSPDGLQLSSLEGHSFAIMSMAVAADQRHLLAVSNRFIMWDISTGQVSRDVDPKIEGSIMKQLKMGLNNAYAIAYTSDNVILVLDILTQQVTKFSGFKGTVRSQGVASSGDSLQQQQQLEARQQCPERILGLDLIDRLGASRFLIWTSTKWFVLRVVNNELTGGGATVATGTNYHLGHDGSSSTMPSRISIKLEYCVDLKDDLGFGELGTTEEETDKAEHTIISVQQAQCLEQDDLTFVVIRTPCGDLKLLTVSCLQSLLGWMCKLWKGQIVGASSLSLDSHLRQLVYSDSRGHIYLSRRRATCWSKPKLIKANSESDSKFDGEASLVKQLNSMAQFGGSLAATTKLRAAAALIPQAIELDSHRIGNDLDYTRETSALLLHGHGRAEMAQFERKIDSLENGDEIEENCVFELTRRLSTINEYGNQTQRQQRQKQAKDSGSLIDEQWERGQSTNEATKFIKLYYYNKIVVMRLDCLANETNRENSLIFPRNIRNISVEPNKCQISSVILEGAGSTMMTSSTGGTNNKWPVDYLVVAVKRKLLLYSIGNEQLLKSIDAHSSRIVQLIPIYDSSSKQQQQRQASDSIKRIASDESGTTISDSGRQLIIASASMDKTVKIWNLNNLDKDVYVLDKLENSIESISLASQRPLAACLARGELGIWDWRTLKLVARVSPADLVRICSSSQPNKQIATTGGHQKSPMAATILPSASKIVRCKFSSNDRYLCLATQCSVHLLSFEDLKVNDSSRSGRRASSSSSSPVPPLDRLVDCRTNFNQRLPVVGMVGKLNFLLQDSRVLVAVDCGFSSGSKNGWSVSQSESIGSEPEGATKNGAKNGQRDQQQRQQSYKSSSGSRPLTSRLLVLCYSVPDGRLLYKIDCMTPTMQISADSTHYFSQMANEQPTGPIKTNLETNGTPASSKSSPASVNGQRTQQQRKQTGLIRLPVVTRDQLHIVTVECSSQTENSTGSEQQQAQGDEHHSQTAAVIGGERLPLDRRKSSVTTKLPITLSVYSTRDGCLVRSINLSHVDLYTGIASPAISYSSITTTAATATTTAAAAGDLQLQRENRRDRITTNHSITTSSSGNNNINGAGSRRPLQGTATNWTATHSGAQISIGGNQFSRLKAVSYRERNSTVALIDDDKGQSYLIDVSSKQLITCSGIWNGKLSSDGRHGLSRMFKSAAAALHRTPDFAGNNSSTNGGLAAAAASAATQAVMAGAGGLQLLEMHHCHPVKSLLTNETLSKLSGGSSEGGGVQASGSDTDITCGFTRPNDSYVYYYDSRLKRLLLIRVRDAQLISNYKLSAQVTKIKCANEGLAIIMGLADGSLTSLAIVDEQKSDTLVYLAQYPSRAR